MEFSLSNFLCKINMNRSCAICFFLTKSSNFYTQNLPFTVPQSNEIWHANSLNWVLTIISIKHWGYSCCHGKNNTKVKIQSTSQHTFFYYFFLPMIVCYSAHHFIVRASSLQPHWSKNNLKNNRLYCKPPLKG